MNALRTIALGAAAVLSLGSASAFAGSSSFGVDPNAGTLGCEHKYAVRDGSGQVVRYDTVNICGVAAAASQPARADACALQVAFWDAEAKVLRYKAIDGCVNEYQRP